MNIRRRGMMWSSDWRKCLFSRKEIRAPRPPSHSHHPGPRGGVEQGLLRWRLLQLLLLQLDCVVYRVAQSGAACWRRWTGLTGQGMEVRVSVVVVG